VEFYRIITVFTYLVLIMASPLAGQISDSLNVATQDTIVQEANDLGLDSPIDYFGKDSTVVDVEHERILLFGEAWVKYGDMELKADFIEFSFTNFTARAVGKRDSTGTVVERATFKENDTEFNWHTISNQNGALATVCAPKKETPIYFPQSPKRRKTTGFLSAMESSLLATKRILTIIFI